MQRAAAAPGFELSVPRPVAGAAVCAALMGATAWAVLAGGWAQDAGGAIVVAVAAAVEGALLARAAVPRVAALLIAPVLALAAIVPTTIAAMPFDGDGSIAHAAARYVAALVGGLGSSGDWQFTVGLCAVLWVCGYWLSWMALRERRGVLAVVPIYAVLATNVLNTKVANNVALPETIAVLGSLLVIAGAHLDSLQARWRTHQMTPLPGTRARFAASVAVIAVVLTIAAALLPGLTSIDISSRFFPGGSGTAHGNGPQHGAGAGGTIQFSPSTQPGGPLISQPVPVLTYSVDTNARVYLRVVNDTLFSEGNWYPASNGGLFGAPDVSQVTLQYSAGPLPRDRLKANGGIGGSEATITADIQLQGSATGSASLAPFTGEPDWVGQDGAAFGEVLNSAASGQPSALLTVDSVQLANNAGPGTLMETRGLVSTATAQELQAAGTNYPVFVQPFIGLGDATPQTQTISTLAKAWTAGTTNPYDAAEAIQAHLRNPAFFTYTLTPSAPPAGEWPIVFFLTRSHAGYCQYFASSMGAMLRSLGIPTRLVSGYGPGTTQAQSGRKGLRQQVVTTSDAHTWVEAYFPGAGWIPFEPTPPSGDGVYNPIPRGAAAVAAPPPSTAAAPTPGGPRPGFNGTDPNQGAIPAPAPPAPVGMIAGIVLAALAMMVALMAMWLMLPRTLRGTWRRLEVLGALMGMRRRVHETHSAYVRRFARTTSAPFAPALAVIAAELGRAEFSSNHEDRAAVRRVLHLWHGVMVRAPGLALRRLQLHPRRRRRLLSGA